MAVTKYISTLFMVWQVYGADFCFDDTLGQITASYTMSSNFRKWRVTWSSEDWSDSHWIEKGSGAMLTASGCCSGGYIGISKRNHGKFRYYNSHFGFNNEDVHVRCAPAVPYCSLSVTGDLVNNELNVEGMLKCNCVPGLTDFEANATTREFETNATFLVESIIGNGYGVIN